MIDDQSIRLLNLMSTTTHRPIQALAATLALDPEAVLARLQALIEEGVAMHLDDSGCRLLAPVECLSLEAIREVMDDATRRRIADIRIFPTIDSTNSYLWQLAEDGQPGPVACLAETQRAGRGRRGRHWASPFAASLYLSVLWQFRPPPTSLPALSLVTGVAVVRAVECLGISGVRLKWPNDLIWQQRKLAGLLLESRVMGQTATVVMGIGLNVSMPERSSQEIDQPWVDLREIAGGAAPSRNRLAAAILDQLALTLPLIPHAGLAPLLADWQRLDGFRDQQVVVSLPDGQQITGTARGVNEVGALRLETGTGEQCFAVGEVSLRAG